MKQLIVIKPTAIFFIKFIKKLLLFDEMLFNFLER